MAETRDFANSKHPEVESLKPVSSHTTDSSTEGANLTFRPRALSHHVSSKTPPSRAWLRTQAQFWRFLMKFAMPMHDLTPPKPPKPSFVKYIQTLPSGSPPISLHFYTPQNYLQRVHSGHRYPVVVNFHGGGFCLGTPTDDRYWAQSVVANTSAVFVSVGYRLAPEFPFPTAVDDSVDALLYLSNNADSLGLDADRVALTGFSAGANLAFTAPLRLKYHTMSLHEEPKDAEDLVRWPATQNLLSAFKGIKICSIVAWYPIVDWSQSRSEKKRHCIKPSKALPKFFTDLFDHSYIPVPDMKGNHASPYTSPALARDAMLDGGLPHDVQMFLCEYDMLLREGQVFSEKLERIGKNVATRIIPKVPHGWDKSPNPFRDQAAIRALYAQACAGLVESFGQDPTPVLRENSLTAPSADTSLAPNQRPSRDSVRENVPL